MHLSDGFRQLQPEGCRHRCALAGGHHLPLQFEREREFINIFRSHDDARNLSDEGFRRVLEFTRQSFEMSLHFVEEQERQGRELRQQLTDLEPGPGRSPRKSGGKSAK